jgi:hypothetical protein
MFHFRSPSCQTLTANEPNLVTSHGSRSSVMNNLHAQHERGISCAAALGRVGRAAAASPAVLLHVFLDGINEERDEAVAAPPHEEAGEGHRPR